MRTALPSQLLHVHGVRWGVKIQYLPSSIQMVAAITTEPKRSRPGRFVDLGYNPNSEKSYAHDTQVGQNAPIQSWISQAPPTAASQRPADAVIVPSTTSRMILYTANKLPSPIVGA